MSKAIAEARLVARWRAKVRENSWTATALCLLIFAYYYAFLLSAGEGNFFSPLPYGLTFNSMLSHLLDGRFDVDPAAIGNEGFLRDGATYAYFGVFPALIRIPFLETANFATTDFTRLGCLSAVCLMAFFKLQSALTIGRTACGESGRAMLGMFILAILASGAQLQFLRPSIFQETSLWANALAAGFIYFAVRGWVGERGFTAPLLTGMALLAGLCLLTRVSTALGLYIALGLLWLRLMWGGRTSRLSRDELAKQCMPMLVLAAFVCAAAYINYRRWGNFLIFVDMTKQIIAQAQYPDRLIRVQQYGEFNPIRLLFGLQYYFMPFWVLRDGSGHLLWSEFQQRTIDFAELPPGSFLISDPLLVGLSMYGIGQLVGWRRLPKRDLLISILAGLLVPIGLILIAIAMTFRYRLEFYPFLELAALIGLSRLIAAPTRRTRICISVTAIIGIFVAHAQWFLYHLSPFGPASGWIGDVGIEGFYRSVLQ